LMSEAFMDVAAYVVQFRQTALDQTQTFAPVQARVMALLSASRTAAAGYSEEDYDEARFAVCAWIDEALTSAAWSGQADWHDSPLQLKFYQTRDAGAQFFERLERLTPRQDPVREVYYLCLALGFKGRCSSERDLKRLKRRLRSNLRRLSGRRLRIPKPHGGDLLWRPESTIGGRAEKSPPLRTLIWLAPPLILAGVYILLSRMLSTVEQGRLTLPDWSGLPSWRLTASLLIATLAAGVGCWLYEVLHIRRFMGQAMALHGGFQKRPETKGLARTDGIRPRFFGRSILARPWFLLMGETGAGKTSAVMRAGLTSKRRVLTPREGFPAVLGLTWWVSDQAVILDPAGPATNPNEPGRERSQWPAFFKLLSRYRQGMRLDGIVVVVAANRLLQARPEALIADGRHMRARIDALLTAHGTVPVTILVTKCDLVHGMTATTGLLDETLLNQAFGAVNPDPRRPGADGVQAIMPALRQRLTRLQRILLAGFDPERDDPGVLLFPQEFARLESGLEIYSQALFPDAAGPNTPVLHGIFFASARQEDDRAPSRFLSALGVAEDRGTVAAADKGLFLRAIFTKVLPESSANTGCGAALFQAVTRHPARLAWTVTGLALCVILGFAAVQNMRAMQDTMAALPRSMLLTGGRASADLAAMQAYQRALGVLERRDQAWWNTHTGLPGSRDMEARLKQDFCRRFEIAVLAPHDRALAVDIANLGQSDPRLGDVMTYLAGRINALKTRAGREDPAREKLKAYGMFLNTAMGWSDRQRFSDLYAARLRWQEDQAALAKERGELMHVLKLAMAKSGDWRWLTVWVNADLHLSPVTLKDFWRGYPQVPDEPRVAPCFTLTGQRRIETLLTAIRAALEDTDAALMPQADFHAWYRGAYAEAWHTLVLNFSQGGTGMEGSPVYRALAGKASAPDGPYFKLLERLSQELEPVRKMQPRPDWIGLVFEMKRIRDASLESQTPSGDAAVKAFRDYRTSLARARAAVTPSRERAFQSASTAFGAESSASPFFAAQNAYQRLNAASALPSEPLWSLVHAPLDCLMGAACQEAGCHLQGVWERTVLAPARTTTDPERLKDLLFGPGGLARAFTQGPAAPFIERDKTRAVIARTVLGRALAFEPAFFAFLAQSEEKISRPEPRPLTAMDLTVEGLPTEANDRARLQPHATRLDLYCDGGVKSLLNMNYPVSRRFAWTPSCSAVALNIAVGDIVLKKTYSGSDALESFLRDFPRGTHTFRPADFPRQAAALQKLGITAITVQYRLIEHHRANDRAPQSTIPRIHIPAKILRCAGP